MIKEFKSTLPDLRVQFQEYLEPLLPEVQEASTYAQEALPSDDQLSEHSVKLGSYLARANGILGEMAGFRQQFKALATEKYMIITAEGKGMAPSLVRDLAGKDTAQCEQFYTIVERLSKTLTHQLENLNARIWYRFQELKQSGSNNQPTRHG